MKKIALVILCLMVVLTGCSMTKNETSSSQKQSVDPAKQVVENYFKYFNDKDKKGLFTTITEWQKAPNVEWGFENLKYIKLNSISEDTRPSQKEAYMKYGRGKVNHAKAENIKNYKVEYTVKYKKDGIGPEDSGKYTKCYTLIRKDKNSPWLIDDGGEG